MNFQIGQKVKIIGEEHVFLIEGFESSYLFQNGVEEEKIEYRLRNIKTKELCVIDEMEIIPENGTSIDFLLDLYNDYKQLHKLFNDKKYELKMEKVITTLKRLNEKHVNLG